MKALLQKILYSAASKRFMDFSESKLPLLREWHRFAYEEHFQRTAKWGRMFRGVYPDFQTALAAIPKGHKIGYDNKETATFLGRTASILPSDYPILLWMQSLLPGTKVLFDFGGYLGFAYNSYKRYCTYPDRLRWIVYDVAAVVEAGKCILEAEPDPTLEYTTVFADASQADIFLAAGSLQFCEEPLAPRLSALERMPKHLLINKVPTTEGTSFVTLQNMGPATSPYQVFQHADFVASLEQLGYELIDGWDTPDFACYIPFHPDQTVRAFRGFYFRLSRPIILRCPQ